MRSLLSWADEGLRKATRMIEAGYHRCSLDGSESQIPDSLEAVDLKVGGQQGIAHSCYGMLLVGLEDKMIEKQYKFVTMEMKKQEM